MWHFPPLFVEWSGRGNAFFNSVYRFNFWDDDKLVRVIISPFVDTIFKNQQYNIFQDMVGIIINKETQQGTPGGKGVKINCRTEKFNDSYPQSIGDGTFTEKVNRGFI